MRELILASGSPRRAELLAELGLVFRIVPSGVVEHHEDRPRCPARLVRALARAKADEVARRLGSGLIIAADTIVIASGAVLEKPADERAAAAMLTRLSGRWHVVHTGVALIDAETGRARVDSARTRVKFRTLGASEIAAYVRTGESFDKAGAYGIQGLGAVLVERIEGCYTNVVGLPLSLLHSMLMEFSLKVL